MNIPLTLLVLSSCFFVNYGRVPFVPVKGTVPFIVYFTSRYRGLCIGSMISRIAVLTAAVCVTDPNVPEADRRPINVIAGTMYRHPMRGVKVQVVEILLPRMLPSPGGERGYIIEQSVAVLMLKHKIPDSLAEVPVRPIYVDYLSNDAQPALQEECATAGWHFFNQGYDKIYYPAKFLLKRYLRVQILNVVKKQVWCETLILMFKASLDFLGYHGIFELDKLYCLRDPEATAQPCHGMYGAPMVCNGHVTGMMMAPDAQWRNCTGCSNIFHKLDTDFLRPFWQCISGLFKPEYRLDMGQLKRSIYERGPGLSFESDNYDKVLLGSGSSSSS